MLLFFIKSYYYFFNQKQTSCYIIFSKRSSHLAINLMWFHYKTNSKKMKKYLYDRDKKYYIDAINYMSSISWFINYLYCCIYIYGLYIVLKKMNKNLQEPDWSFFSFWNLKSHYLAYSHWFSFIWWHPLSFFCYSLAFAVTCCHLLSLLVIRCHLLRHVVLAVRLVVTCCTTRCH